MPRVSDTVIKPCRLIVEAALPPAANMARDEALLISAAESGSYALRFYRWRPHSISLGYFQRWEDFQEHVSRGTPVIRRPSGGGAIFHADELTYSLSAPHDGRFPKRASAVFRLVHECIVAGLSRLGVEAGLCDGPTGASPLVCFSRPQRYDVVVGGRKLLGSAQRRRRGAFLQHGSLVLSPNEFAPEAVSLRELIPGPIQQEALIEALVAAFCDGLGLDIRPGAYTRSEVAEAERLEAEKYSTSQWNRRR